MDDPSAGPDESWDLLAGEWRILQLKRGHRFSTDDLATAWRAAAHRPPGATRLLDLGCGIGSVGLLTLWRTGDPQATLVGVEAQAVSVGLARRTVLLNGLSDRVRILEGDLRDPGVLPEGSAFDVVTGSPPYIPVGMGVISPVPQRAGARIELRGSVIDYATSARRWLAPGGRFTYVMAAADPRGEEAARQARLVVLERCDLIFRGGRTPLVSTFVCAREEDGPFPPTERKVLIIRDEAGDWTPEYHAFRREMGSPDLSR